MGAVELSSVTLDTPPWRCPLIQSHVVLVAVRYFFSHWHGCSVKDVGGSGGHWLPRAGGWMDTVKAFGVGLLAVAYG